MNNFAKSAAAATFSLALVVGAGSSAMAYEKKPVCPTTNVIQATTPSEYIALSNSYQQYTNATETAYNLAVIQANSSVNSEIAVQKQALEAAKVAAKVAKAAVKTAKDALKAANAAFKADPSNVSKQIAANAAKAEVKAKKAEVKAAKDVVEAQRDLLHAERKAQEKSRKAIKKATEERSKALKSCVAPKEPKVKKPKGKKG